MTRTAPAPGSTRATLWIASLLLLVTAVAHLRVSLCRASCSADLAGGGTACCTAADGTFAGPTFDGPTFSGPTFSGPTFAGGPFDDVRCNDAEYHDGEYQDGGPTTCCDCCAPAARAGRSALGEHGAGDGDRPAPNGSLRGTCAPGCCQTLAFEDVELAPAPSGTTMPDHQPVACAELTMNSPTSDQHPLTRGRPFDRGPPRVDARTALRACTVLLI